MVNTRHSYVSRGSKSQRTGGSSLSSWKGGATSAHLSGRGSHVSTPSLAVRGSGSGTPLADGGNSYTVANPSRSHPSTLSSKDTVVTVNLNRDKNPGPAARSGGTSRRSRSRTKTEDDKGGSSAFRADPARKSLSRSGGSVRSSSMKSRRSSGSKKSKRSDRSGRSIKSRMRKERHHMIQNADTTYFQVKNSSPSWVSLVRTIAVCVVVGLGMVSMTAWSLIWSSEKADWNDTALTTTVLGGSVSLEWCVSIAVQLSTVLFLMGVFLPLAYQRLMMELLFAGINLWSWLISMTSETILVATFGVLGGITDVVAVFMGLVGMYSLGCLLLLLGDASRYHVDTCRDKTKRITSVSHPVASFFGVKSYTPTRNMVFFPSLLTMSISMLGLFLKWLCWFGIFLPWVLSLVSSDDGPVGVSGRTFGVLCATAFLFCSADVVSLVGTMGVSLPAGSRDFGSIVRWTMIFRTLGVAVGSMTLTSLVTWG